MAAESSGPDAVEGVSSGIVPGRSVLWCGRVEVLFGCVDLMESRFSLARTDRGTKAARVGGLLAGEDCLIALLRLVRDCCWETVVDLTWLIVSFVDLDCAWRLELVDWVDFDAPCCFSVWGCDACFEVDNASGTVGREGACFLVTDE